MSGTETLQDDATDLALAATNIFGGTSNCIPLKEKDGKKRLVIISAATMEHLPTILKFFRSVIDGMDPGSMGRLIDMIVDAQKRLIASGQDPNKVDLKALMTADDDASEAMVRKAFGNASLVTELFAASLEHMPMMAAAFTNLSAAEYNALDPDEGLLLAGGIFTVNYSFFIRTLPPILTAAMRGWASRNVANAPRVPTPASTKKAVARRSK